MPVLVLLLLVAWPFAEYAAFVAVAHAVGVLDALVLLFLVSVAGGWLCRRFGSGALRRFRAAVGAGELPGPEVVDGLLILVGGALMVLPGFVSGAVGLLLLLPPTRRPLRALVLHRVRRRFDVRIAGVSSVDAVVDVEGWEVPPSGPRSLPGSTRRPVHGGA